MTLTTEQTALMNRAKALIEANPNDHTTTMELVRGLVAIVEMQKFQLEVNEGDFRTIIKEKQRERDVMFGCLSMVKDLVITSIVWHNLTPDGVARVYDIFTLLSGIGINTNDLPTTD